MKRQFRVGYQEAMSESIRFLVELEGHFAGDGLCLRMVNHMHQHYEKLDKSVHVKPSSGSEPSSKNGLGRDTDVSSPFEDIKPDIRQMMSNKMTPKRDIVCDMEIDQDCEAESKQNESAPSSMTAGLDSGSQLRKMLEAKESPILNGLSHQTLPTGGVTMSPNPMVTNGTGVASGSQKSSAPSPTPSLKSAPSPGSELNASGATSSGRKNYKKEIRERFQATMSNSNSSSSGSPPVSITVNTTKPHSNSTSSHLDLTNGDSADHHQLNQLSPHQFLASHHRLSGAPLGSPNPHPGEKLGSVYERPMSSVCATVGCSSSNCSCGGEPLTMSGVHHHFPNLCLPNHSDHGVHGDHSSSYLPGFALHPNGSFYVPVRLEPHLVSRFLTPDQTQTGSPASVIHPINIAVNFSIPSTNLFLTGGVSPSMVTNTTNGVHTLHPHQQHDGHRPTAVYS